MENGVLVHRVDRSANLAPLWLHSDVLVTRSDGKIMNCFYVAELKSIGNRSYVFSAATKFEPIEVIIKGSYSMLDCVYESKRDQIKRCRVSWDELADLVDTSED